MSSQVNCSVETQDVFGNKSDDEENCEITLGETFDTLKIKTDKVIPAKSVHPIIVNVNEVRGPSSTSPVLGFNIKTTDKDGRIIDATNEPNTISLQASSP